MKRKLIVIAAVLFLLGLFFFQGKKIASVVAPPLLSLVKSDCQFPEGFEIVYVGFEPKPWLIEATRCDLKETVELLKGIGYTQWPERVVIGIYSPIEFQKSNHGVIAGKTLQSDEELGLVVMQSGAGWDVPSIKMRRYIMAHELTHIVQGVRSCGFRDYGRLTRAINEGEAVMVSQGLPGTLSSDEVWLDKMMSGTTISNSEIAIAISDEDMDYLSLQGLRYSFYNLFARYLLEQTPGGKKWGRNAFYLYDSGRCSFNDASAFTFAFKVSPEDALNGLAGFRE